MKRTLFTVLLLFALVPGAWGGNDIIIGDGFGVSPGTIGIGGGAYVSPPPGGVTYDITEDFEGAGYENGTCGSAPCWTEGGTGTVDPNYTVVVISGSQSLLLDDYDDGHPAEATLSLPAAASTLNLYFQWRTGTLSAGVEAIVQLKDSLAANVVQITISTGGGASFDVVTGGENGDSGVLPLVNTTYHLWLDYTAGTGADSACNLYISTSAIKPGSPQIAISAGNELTDAIDIVLRAQDMESIFDTTKITTDGTTIGSNP